MASSQLFFAIIAIVIVPSVLATDFIVGDDGGWRNNFDYQAWANGKEFRVGDKLVFKYSEGVHTVRKVNGTGFQDCTAPASAEALTSGNDVVTLISPGRKWYICGVGKHCEVGKQKLAITVLPSEGAPASSPIPTSDASLKFHVWTVPMIATLVRMLFS
ncbi:putative Blue copper protein precursor [Tripterygium wilfordii]|uniref:Putative Blue copper protein n=1 Tax=Tripterygium wilfordii TaxID=458696 RepID=A0A7J7DUH0_TRIWF|nr:blue copper protein 1a-like [Tripterygium wilfordii]KAF5750018.1 putative Blue copper protein precursor [Tripterygium wilfordii]